MTSTPVMANNNNPPTAAPTINAEVEELAYYRKYVDLLETYRKWLIIFTDNAGGGGGHHHHLIQLNVVMDLEKQYTKIVRPDHQLVHKMMNTIGCGSGDGGGAATTTTVASATETNRFRPSNGHQMMIDDTLTDVANTVVTTNSPTKTIDQLSPTIDIVDSIGVDDSGGQQKTGSAVTISNDVVMDDEDNTVIVVPIMQTVDEVVTTTITTSPITTTTAITAAAASTTVATISKAAQQQSSSLSSPTMMWPITTSHLSSPLSSFQSISKSFNKTTDNFTTTTTTTSMAKTKTTATTKTVDSSSGGYRQSLSTKSSGSTATVSVDNKTDDHRRYQSYNNNNKRLTTTSTTTTSSSSNSRKSATVRPLVLNNFVTNNNNDNRINTTTHESSSLLSPLSDNRSTGESTDSLDDIDWNNEPFGSDIAAAAAKRIETPVADTVLSMKKSPPMTTVTKKVFNKNDGTVRVVSSSTSSPLAISSATTANRSTVTTTTANKSSATSPPVVVSSTSRPPVANISANTNNKTRTKPVPPVITSSSALVSSTITTTTGGSSSSSNTVNLTITTNTNTTTGGSANKLSAKIASTAIKTITTTTGNTGSSNTVNRTNTNTINVRSANKLSTKTTVTRSIPSTALSTTTVPTTGTTTGPLLNVNKSAITYSRLSSSSSSTTKCNELPPMTTAPQPSPPVPPIGHNITSINSGLKPLVSSGQYVSMVDTDDPLICAIHQNIGLQTAGTTAVGYKCNYNDCTFMSPSMDTTRQHTHRHLADNPFICDLCDKAYPFADYERHQLLIHPQCGNKLLVRCRYRGCHYWTGSKDRLVMHCNAQHSSGKDDETVGDCRRESLKTCLKPVITAQSDRTTTTTPTPVVSRESVVDGLVNHKKFRPNSAVKSPPKPSITKPPKMTYSRNKSSMSSSLSSPMMRMMVSTTGITNLTINTTSITTSPITAATTTASTTTGSVCSTTASAAPLKQYRTILPLNTTSTTTTTTLTTSADTTTIATTERSVRCQHSGCELLFKTTFTMKDHYNRIHRSDTYECQWPECTAGRFSSRRELKVHVDRHMDKQNTLGKLKSALASGQYTLRPNSSNHNNCNKMYSAVIAANSNEKLGFKCKHGDCNFNHIYQYLMRQHYATHYTKTNNNTNNGSQYQCDICGKTFALKIYVRHHQNKYHRKLRQKSKSKPRLKNNSDKTIVVQNNRKLRPKTSSRSHRSSAQRPLAESQTTTTSANKVTNNNNSNKRKRYSLRTKLKPKIPATVVSSSSPKQQSSPKKVDNDNGGGGGGYSWKCRHNNGNYRCSKTFTSSALLEKHKTEEHMMNSSPVMVSSVPPPPTPALACNWKGCTKRFDSQTELHLHRRSHNRSSRLTYQLRTDKPLARSRQLSLADPKRSPSSSLSTAAAVAGTLKGRYRCDYEGCNKSYAFKETLYLHSKSHKNNNYNLRK